MTRNLFLVLLTLCVFVSSAHGATRCADLSLFLSDDTPQPSAEIWPPRDNAWPPIDDYDVSWTLWYPGSPFRRVQGVGICWAEVIEPAWFDDSEMRLYYRLDGYSCYCKVVTPVLMTGWVGLPYDLGYEPADCNAQCSKVCANNSSLIFQMMMERYPSSVYLD